MLISKSRRPHAQAGWPLAVLSIALSACSTQAPHVAAPLPVPAAWSVAAASDLLEAAAPDLWWTQLNDQAVNVLTAAALDDNPTLQQALARIDEADANLGISAAQRLPALQANLGGSRARSVEGGQASYTSAGVAGLALSWEIDLFGRVRSSVDSARSRLDARHADADAARLSLAARVADTVLALRGCQFAQAVLSDDVASRTITLELTRHKLAVGALAPVDEARARTSVAAAQTTLASRQQQCSGHLNALVALTGRDGAAIDALLAAPLRRPTAASTPVILPRYTQWMMPAAPAHQLALPATVLARHPSVRAAEAELAAAWADIGVARAERLPRLDLGAALSGQWLRAGGSGGTERDRLWSLAPSLSVPLFDNGRGAAAVSANQARYRQALATLQATVRDAARDVEDALAAQRSASTRFDTTRAASLFVLEDAHRQLASAQNDAITAARDASQAWVALVLACGHSPLTTESLSDETV